MCVRAFCESIFSIFILNVIKRTSAGNTHRVSDLVLSGSAHGSLHLAAALCGGQALFSMCMWETAVCVQMRVHIRERPAQCEGRVRPCSGRGCRPSSGRAPGAELGLGAWAAVSRPSANTRCDHRVRPESCEHI